MTAKSGFYGTDEPEYRKELIPTSKEAYFMQVNKTTGEMEVWNEEVGQDRKVATLDKDGNLVFDRTLTKGARDFEERFLATDDGKKAIREFAEFTVIKDKTTGRNNEGETPEPIPEATARVQTDQLLDTGNEETPDDADPNDVAAKSNEEFNNSLSNFGSDLGTRGGTKSGAGAFGNFAYPKDRRTTQDFMKFTLLEYAAKDVGSGTGGKGFGFSDRDRVGPNGESSGRTILGSVSLPVPGGLKDENGATWGPDKMDESKIQLGKLALTMASGGDAGKVAKEIADRIGSGSKEVKTAIQGILAGNAVGARNLLTRMSGAVLNPNLELLFQEPSLRPFTFTFDLAPRNKEEADEVVKIIKFFKQGMSPIRSESNLFLKSPHTFQVHFIKGGTSDENPFIGKMKECAMTSFAVDYTPQQNYSTLAGGYMTSYKIEMRMKELEPVFNDDYGTGDTVEIGF
jgi:hypothetical protein